MRKSRKHLFMIIKIVFDRINFNILNEELKSIQPEELERYKKSVQTFEYEIERAKGFIYDFLKFHYSNFQVGIEKSKLSVDEFYGDLTQLKDIYNLVGNSLKIFDNKIRPKLEHLFNYHRYINRIGENKQHDNYKVYSVFIMDYEDKRNFIIEISNYFICKILIEQIPQTLKSELKEYILNILPEVKKNEERKPNVTKFFTSEEIKLAHDRRKDLLELNENIHNLFGTDIAEGIVSAKENYQEDSLLDSDLILREVFLAPMFDNFRFSKDKIPNLYRYILMHDILSLTHPSEFTSIKDWEKNKGDAKNSALFNKKRKEEVIKFFNNKKLEADD